MAKSITILWLLNAAFFICSFFIQDQITHDVSLVCASEKVTSKGELAYLLATGSSFFSENLELGTLDKQDILIFNIKKYSFAKSRSSISTVFIQKLSRAPPAITFS